MVDLQPLDDDDRAWLRATVGRHGELTGSRVAERLLEHWEREVDTFRKVMPTDYQRVLDVIAEAERLGLSEDERNQKIMEAASG